MAMAIHYDVNEMICHFADDSEPEKDDKGWNNTKCMANVAKSGDRCDKKAVWQRRLSDWPGYEFLRTCGNHQNWVHGRKSKSPGTSPDKQVKILCCCSCCCSY